MPIPSICFIDHHDSFSWNLIAQIRALGFSPEIIQADSINRETSRAIHSADLLMLSPGPGSPTDYPGTMGALREALACRQSILGVCLGFQAILAAAGARIIRQPRVLHGVQTPLKVLSRQGAFRNMGDSVTVARYHSLCVSPGSIPAGFSVVGIDPETNVVLAVEHNSLPVIGLQFHPDSFLTPRGDKILENCFAALLNKSSRKDAKEPRSALIHT